MHIALCAPTFMQTTITIDAFLLIIQFLDFTKIIQTRIYYNLSTAYPFTHRPALNSKLKSPSLPITGSNTKHLTFFKHASYKLNYHIVSKTKSKSTASAWYVVKIYRTSSLSKQEHRCNSMNYLENLELKFITTAFVDMMLLILLYEKRELLHSSLL